MDWGQFFTVHQDLPREGPGCCEDVAWALSLANPGPAASICDLATGPGADIAALLAGVPEGHLTAIDKRAEFVAAAKAGHPDQPRLSVEQGDMAEIAEHSAAPFDLIWCAGALYFLGLEAGLARMSQALRPAGVLCFSEPCFFTTSPSEDATAFWEGYPTGTATSIAEAIAAAGFELLGQRVVADPAWEAYFEPMDARIEMLRAQGDPALAEMLDLCADEARHWRRVKSETGYILNVARVSK